MHARDAFVATRMNADAVAVLTAADTLTHRLEQTATIEHLDWEPPCEGLDHARALHGHQPGQAASYMLIAPCHGPRIMICAARRNYLLGLGLLRCNVCKVETLVERWLMVPIDGGA